MKENVAKKWVEALRSGKYEQIKGAMKTSDGFCCLGVLQFEVLNIPFDGYQRQVLSEKAMEESGMSSDNGRLHRGNCLSALNDHGKTFSEIADVIEEKWEIL